MKVKQLLRSQKRDTFYPIAQKPGIDRAFVVEYNTIITREINFGGHIYAAEISIRGC